MNYLIFWLLVLEISLSSCINLFPGEEWKTGYIDVGEGNNLFYYHFKTRNKTLKNPPLVIWLEGGPGASSALGVWSEGGPYIVDNKTSEIIRNPYLKH